MHNFLMLFADISLYSGLVSLITGSGGALVVLMMWVRSLLASNKQLEEENRSISRQSVECITKILERQDQEKDLKTANDAWKRELTGLMNRICRTLNLKKMEET